MPPKAKKNSDIQEGDESAERGRTQNTTEVPPRTRSLSRARANEPLMAQMDRAHEEQARRLELIMNTLQQQSEVMQECLNTVGTQGRDLLRLRNQVDQLPRTGYNAQPQGFSFQQSSNVPTTAPAQDPVPAAQLYPAAAVADMPPQTAPTSAYPPQVHVAPGDRIMAPSAQGFQPAPASTVSINVRPSTAATPAISTGPVVNQPRPTGAQGGPLPLDHTPLVHKPAVMDLLNQRGGPGAPQPARSASAPRTGTRPSGPAPNGRPASQSPPANRAPFDSAAQARYCQGAQPNNQMAPNPAYPPNNAQNNGYPQNNAQGYQQPYQPAPPAAPAPAPQANAGNIPPNGPGPAPGPRPAMPGAGGGGGGGDGDGNGPNGPNNNQYGQGFRAARAARANNNGVPQVGLLDPAVRERGKVLSQIRLPKFSNRATTDHWIQQVREAHEVYNTTDQEIIYVAKNAMHGEVAAAVRDLNTADMTIEDFFTAIRKEVLPTDNRAHARAALTGLYQGKKDLYDFKHHTLSLTMRAHDLDIEGAQRIGVLSFIGGLADEDISDKVLDKDPQTIEEAYILADRFQAIARDKARRKRLSAVYKDRDPEDDVEEKEAVAVNFMRRGFEANKASHKDTTRDLGARLEKRLAEQENLVKRLDNNRADDMQRLYNKLKEVNKQNGQGNRANNSHNNNHNNNNNNDNRNRYRGKENQPPRHQNSGQNRLNFTNNNNRNSGNNHNNNQNGNYRNNNRSAGSWKPNWSNKAQQRVNRIQSHVRHLLAEVGSDSAQEDDDMRAAEGAAAADFQEAEDALRADYGSEEEEDDGVISESDDGNSSN